MRLKNARQFEALRESGKRLAQVMDHVSERIAVGVSTGELDRVAEASMRDLGGVPVFKGYGKEHGNPFPASICTSINDEVVHGIPSGERTLKEGDVVKVDMGIRFDGMVTDMARTFPVGMISDAAKRLLSATEQSLLAGIDAIRLGARLSDYARAVETMVKKRGFSAVRDLVGHGVGFELHEAPQIPNYVGSGLPDIVFRSGMAVALEPMINAGGSDVRLAEDGWTFLSSDGSLSAHFEDTIIITDTGVEIVTRPSGENS